MLQNLCTTKLYCTNAAVNVETYKSPFFI